MKTTKIFKLFLLVLFAFLSFENNAFSQTFDKKNPIIFADESLGGAFGNAGGLAIVLGMNYQVNGNLFTVRYVGTAKFGVDIIAPMVPLPFINLKNSMGEVAILYGLRMVEGDKGYSFSLGVSYNEFDQYYDKSRYNERRYEYIGVPFEANVKWFKSVKKRFLIYGLVPVGKPTAFGGSIGFKLFGNISKQSYAGVALSIGLGSHKVYD